MTRFAILLAVLLVGCAEAPTKCITGHSPGVQIKSTDPRIASVNIVPTVTTVCLTPAYAVASDPPASAP